MKKVIHFTQARIRDLPSPEKGRVEYYDDEIKKLMCRVSSTGNKTFAVVKWQNGKTIRVTLGSTSDITVLDAKRDAQKILTAINSGINPTKEKRKQDAEKITLSQALEMYLSSRELKPRTIKDYRYKIHHDLAEWEGLPVSEITEDMVIKKQKQLSQRGKTLANAAMRVLRLIMNYGVAVGMTNNNPADILSKARLWHKNNRKSRVIPSDQLRTWHKAVDELPNHKAKVYLLMLLYMGFRSNEALALEWSNVDLKAKKITQVDTKNGTNHTLPIPAPLLPNIKTLRDLTGSSKWLFASDNPDKPMSVPRKPIDAIIRATGIEFSPHDCRRTFATIAEAVNLPLTMIKRLMNHVTTNDVTGGYIVTEEETLREAINKVADYIQARVTLEGNVVQLRTKK